MLSKQSIFFYKDKSVFFVELRIRIMSGRYLSGLESTEQTPPDTAMIVALCTLLMTANQEQAFLIFYESKLHDSSSRFALQLSDHSESSSHIVRPNQIDPGEDDEHELVS
jgi:hypothetical protein